MVEPFSELGFTSLKHTISVIYKCYSEEGILTFRFNHIVHSLLKLTIMYLSLFNYFILNPLILIIDNKTPLID